MSTTRAVPQLEQERNHAADFNAVGAAHDQYATAFNSNDAKAVAAFYAEDAVLMLPGIPAIQDRQAIKAMFEDYFKQNVAKIKHTPLGEDFYFRLPEEIPNSRLATLSQPRAIDMLLGFSLRLALDAFNPRSNIYRALDVNPGTAVYQDEGSIYARNLEVPAGGGVGTARAIAHAYSIFATGGREVGLRKETLELLAAPPIAPKRGFYDECLKSKGIRFPLGFAKPSASFPFGSPSSFGSPGAGGSLGFADPVVEVGYAYVTSKMGTRLNGDPRDVALRNALSSAISASQGAAPVAA